MTATLVVKAGITDKKEYRLEPGRAYFIGRSREADIIVKDQQASRRHCAIEASPDGQWTLADQDSSNGTYVNRQRTATRVLQDGDVVQIGKTKFELHLGSAAAQPAQEKAPEPDTIVVKATPQPESGPASPQPPPRPAPSPGPAPAPKPVADDEDLKDLFSFLDKVEAGDRPADEKPERESDGRSVAHEPPPVTPPPAEPKEEQNEEGALFSLLDKADPAAPQPGQPEQPPEEKREKKGGLLSFLRKKKKE